MYLVTALVVIPSSVESNLITRSLREIRCFLRYLKWNISIAEFNFSLEIDHVIRSECVNMAVISLNFLLSCIWFCTAGFLKISLLFLLFVLYLDMETNKTSTTEMPNFKLNNQGVRVSHQLAYHKPQQNVLHKKWSFPLRISSVNVTEEILNGKLYFLCSAILFLLWFISNRYLLS